jgi:hypothetical protein
MRAVSRVVAARMATRASGGRIPRQGGRDECAGSERPKRRRAWEDVTSAEGSDDWGWRRPREPTMDPPMPVRTNSADALFGTPTLGNRGDDVRLTSGQWRR